jgi:hypothetical protein
VLRGGGGAELLGDWVQDVPAFRLAWWPPVSSD